MNKKIIAPIIIAVLFILYFAAIGFGVFVVEPFSLPTLIVVAVVLYSVITMIVVTIERVKEIKEDENNDLDKY